MKISPLSEEQIQYLNWILNDWSHNIKHKGIVIPDIVKKMAKGVQIAVICTTLFTACANTEHERKAAMAKRTAERMEKIQGVSYEQLKNEELKAYRDLHAIERRVSEMEADSILGEPTPKLACTREKMIELGLLANSITQKRMEAK